ncbi:MAG: helix-turn-helix transcriptional regulator [Lysobacteraceae bacterium]
MHAGRFDRLSAKCGQGSGCRTWITWSEHHWSSIPRRNIYIDYINRHSCKSSPSLGSPYGRGDVAAKLGAAIRGRRTALGFSRDTFADEIGMHRAYYSAIERGAERHPPNAMARCAGAQRQARRANARSESLTTWLSTI